MRKTKPVLAAVNSESNGGSGGRRALNIRGPVLIAIAATLAACSGNVDSNGAGQVAPGVPLAPGLDAPAAVGAPVVGGPAVGAPVVGGPAVGAPVVGGPETPAGGAQPGAAPSTSCVAGQLSMGESPLVRLSSRDLSNSLRDIFDVDVNVATLSASDETGGSFIANIKAPVSDPVVANYASLAVSVASQVVGKLDDLVDCQGQNAVCARAFIEQYAPLVYRRPLETGETDLLMTAFDTADKFETGMHLVLKALLQSPFFLYRDETRGQEVAPGMKRLTGYEVATRLSFALFNTTPSRELMDLAATGALDTAAGIDAQLEIMLADPLASEAIADFHYQWLDLGALESGEKGDKDADLFPEFNDGVKAAMLNEVERFTQHVLQDGDGRLETLLTAPYSLIERPLFSIYGLEDPGENHDPSEPTQLDPAERSGLLTLPAVMTRYADPGQSSPILRGVWVRENLLCQHLPAPPPDVDVNVPEIDPNLTTAERFAMHTSDPACAGCHELIDSVGFGFEHYDAIGRYRTEEGNARPVDANGTIISLAQGDLTFNGAPELGRALVGTQEVHECVTQQWFNYTLSRPNLEADACVMETALQAFRGSDLDIRQLLRTLLISDAFRHVRTP